MLTRYVVKPFQTEHASNKNIRKAKISNARRNPVMTNDLHRRLQISTERWKFPVFTKRMNLTPVTLGLFVA